MRRLAVLLLCCCPPAATGAAPVETPWPRLAARLADQLVGAAAGRPLELREIENRSERPGAALDLRALVLARLAGRAALAEDGPRLRVEALLTHSGARLVVSARLIEEPSGRLVDILSASVEADPALVPLEPGAARAELPVEVAARTRSTPLEGPVLDLLLLGDERVLVLTPDALALHRWNGQELTLEARQALPGPPAVVRHPGGLLLSAYEGAAWAVTSSAAQAVLYEARGGRLVERSRAAALPWRDAPRGLRFRPGTDWIEGPLPGLGDGPFLAFEPTAGELAVSAAAELLVAGADGPRPTGRRCGPALAPLWSGLYVAASADPPGAHDRPLLFERADRDVVAGPPFPVEFDGAVRSLATRPGADAARLVVAVEEPAGATHLEVLELRRAEPQP